MEAEVKNDDNKKRPFTIDLEAGIARSFIRVCKEKGVYVRETLRDLIVEFVKKHDQEKNK